MVELVTDCELRVESTAQDEFEDGEILVGVSLGRFQEGPDFGRVVPHPELDVLDVDASLLVVQSHFISGEKERDLS